MSPATATAYLGGRHGVPDDATIEAFVAVLPVTERAVREAAGVSAAGQPWAPPESARYLTDRQRKAVEELISSMTERQDLSDGNTATTTHAGGRPARDDEEIGVIEHESIDLSQVAGDYLDMAQTRRHEAD